MTEMTELEAVRRLCAPLGETAIISDGADDWTPAGLIAELEGDEEVLDLAVVPGETVRRIDHEGYIEIGEPTYRVRAAGSVTLDEVEEWTAEHIPEALKAVQEVVASPEVSVRPCYDGREYWVWESGEIPTTVLDALEGVTLALDVWAHEEPVSISPEEVAEYEEAIKGIDAVLPSSSPDGVSWPEVIRWADAHGGAGRLVAPVVWSSPLISVRDDQCAVWESGEIPQTVEEYLSAAADVVEEWVATGEIHESEAGAFREDLAALRAALER